MKRFFLSSLTFFVCSICLVAQPSPIALETDSNLVLKKISSLIEEANLLLKREPDAAITSIKRAEFNADLLKNDSIKIEALLVRSEINIRLSEYFLAEEILTRCLELLKKNPSRKIELQVYTNLARVSYYTKNYRQSNLFFKYGQKLAAELKDSSHFYYLQALESYVDFYYQRSPTLLSYARAEGFLNYVLKKNDEKYYSSAYNIMAGAEKLIKRNFKQSERLYLQALKYTERQDDFWRKQLIAMNLIDLYNSERKAGMAIKLLRTTIEESKRTNAPLLIRNAYTNLSTSFALVHQYDSAYLYLLKSQKINSDLMNSQIEKNFKHGFSLYNLEKTEKESLSREIEDKSKEFKIQLLEVVILGLFISVCLILFINFQRRKHLKMTIEQSEEIAKALSSLEITNAQLKETTEAAEKASRSKQEFLSMMSHEIRTPLNIIIGISQHLNSENVDKKLSSDIEVLNFSAENLMMLLNDILDLSKIEAGKMQLDNQYFDVLELLTNIKKSFEGKANLKGIELISDFNFPESTWILSDRLRLGQVLNNLISNAIKFTAQGSVRIIMRMSESDSFTYSLYFSVEDTGIGIKAEEQKQIFELFSQANKNIATRFGGTGMGLNISRRILALMKSDLKVESEFGKGSKFFFEILVPKGSEESSKVLEARKGRNFRDNLSVLVVDDTEGNAIVVQNFLSKWGISSEWIPDASNIVDFLSNHSFDLILMDLRMPGVDGFEATKAIRKKKQFEKMPIIAMSASTLSSHKAEVEAVGFTDYLAKPFKKSTLQHLLEKYLS